MPENKESRFCCMKSYPELREVQIHLYPGLSIDLEDTSALAIRAVQRSGRYIRTKIRDWQGAGCPQFQSSDH
jgi:hypothetical protein